MRKRFALIGCGHIGRRHAAEMQRVGELLAVCDTHPIAARELSKTYHCPAFHSLDELLQAGLPIDWLAVCTPNYLHAEHSMRALDAGWNVLCEKPMCLKLTEAEAMLEMARSTNRQLVVVKQNRFNPPVQRVKQWLNNNQLGRVLSFQVNGFWNRPDAYFETSDWKGRKEMDGGALFTQFSHFIDLLYYLLGEVQHIQGIVRNAHHPHNSTEDTGMALIEMKSGAVGTLHYTINAFDRNMEGSITLFAEKGTVKIGGQYLNQLSYQLVEGVEPVQLPAGNTANDYGLYQGTMSNHPLLYDLLVQPNAASTLLANAEDGMKTVEIINRFYQSAGIS